MMSTKANTRAPHLPSTAPSPISARLAMRRRTTRSLAVLGILALCACSPHEVAYGPVLDVEAIGRAVGVWQGEVDGRVMTVTLCEDHARAAVEDSKATDDGGCQREHLARSVGGRSHIEPVRGGVGCGGCPFAVQAMITGELDHPDLPAPISFTQGTLLLGDGYEDDPYALPYNVDLGSAQDGLGATLTTDGKLVLTLVNVSGSGGLRLPKALTYQGPASCPAP